MANAYYAVRKGHEPGIYHTWDECQIQTLGYSGAQYKKFKTEAEAQEFLNPSGPKCAHLTDGKLDLNGLVAYVDGSHNSKHRVAGYGIVFVLNGERLWRLAQGFALGDLGAANVSGELMGAMKAVEFAQLNGYNELVIGYDYSGIAHFANGDWTPKSEDAKVYAQFMAKMQETMTLSFLKIEGHNGHQWNEEADKLANVGVKRFIGESVEPILKKLNPTTPLA